MQITFGVIKGYLYRVHKYAASSGRVLSKASQSAGIPDDKIRQYLDGQHAFDQISTELCLNDKEITAAIKGQDTVLIHR